KAGRAAAATLRCPEAAGRPCGCPTSGKGNCSIAAADPGDSKRMKRDADSPFGPTVIVVHPKEKRSKCSVEPLRGRDDFIFWTYPHRGPEPLTGYVRLGFGGPL